jgi:hypothetical protein
MNQQGILTYCPICGHEVYPASDPCRYCDAELDPDLNLEIGLTPCGNEFSAYESYSSGLITHKEMAQSVKRFYEKRNDS